MKKLQIEEFEIEFTRKKVKNINLRVDRSGIVKVSAPYFVSENAVLSFLKIKLPWIKRKVSAAQKKLDIKPVYNEGDLLSLFGKKYVVRYIKGSDYHIELFNDIVYICTPPDSSSEKRMKYIEAWYRKMLHEALAKKIPEWEERTGLLCDGWRIRKMKSRWGTCNTITKELCFNLKLAMYQPKYLDYVILHELAHTKIGNHGKEFWGIVNSYMSDCSVRRRELNNL